jgi:SAM-dependent methyltransferase
VFAKHSLATSGCQRLFLIGLIEQLPFPDQSFNVVLSTLMMHHLPDDLKRQGLQEIARVLKPGGRLLILDFRHPEEHQRPPALHIHTGKGKRSTSIQDQPALMKEAGFSQIETGETKFPGLGFALGKINEA